MSYASLLYFTHLLKLVKLIAKAELFFAALISVLLTNSPVCNLTLNSETLTGAPAA